MQIYTRRPATGRTDNGNGRYGHVRDRIVMASNRAPVEHYYDGAGLAQRCGPGGVATALASIKSDLPVTWIASATSDADRELASAGRAVSLARDRRLRLVAPPADAYDMFYGVFCNPVLWFVQHGLGGRLQERDASAISDAWERGYLPTNQAFAEAIAQELDLSHAPGRVMLHDYHLYAAPLFIRNRRPNAVLQHFIHIPWPAPDAWSALPRHIVESICEGLLANDSVVFQTRRSVENFLRTCEANLPGARAGSGGHVVYEGRRRTRVWHNPVSVDVWDLRSQIENGRGEAYRQKLRASGGMRTIVRVDRLDPTKNVAAGFRAYGRLLEQHPEWIGTARFLAFLVPSRTSIPEYEQYAREVLCAVDGVNRRFGREGWTPIELFHEHNRTQALVALSMYDVLLVNSVIDGMNLVSKEGPVLNERDGVLVLSETAGSFDELHRGAFGVSPHDIDGTAEALHAALGMPIDERRERARLLREAVMRHSLRRWLRLLLEDLEASAAPAGKTLAAGGVAYGGP
jgi:trehalose 6-phosphate synthase